MYRMNLLQATHTKCLGSFTLPLTLEGFYWCLPGYEMLEAFPWTGHELAKICDKFYFISKFVSISSYPSVKLIYLLFHHNRI